MSSALVKAIVEVLTAGGYSARPTPFKVASVDFAFTAALIGSAGRSLDLVLIIDTATGDHGDRDPLRVRQRIEALSRALDITGSRYVITTVLAGAMLTGAIEALAATCRVLTVDNVPIDDTGKLADASAVELLEDQIRVLLPLKLSLENEEQDIFGTDPMKDLRAALPSHLDADLVARLADAASLGEYAVTNALAIALDEALETETHK